VTDRARYIVGARKIAPEDRDVARAAMTPESGYAGFADVIDADDDPAVPLGADVAYAVDLTEAEADRFRAASNARYVERDQARRMAVVDARPVLGAANADTPIPPTSTMRYMGVTPEAEAAWHGRDIPVAVLDGGTSAAVKARFGWQVVAHRDFTGAALGPDGTTVEHGCWVTPLAVPAAGRLVQAIVFDGQGSAYDSWIAAAVKWAVDAGARVVNFSGGGGGPPSARASRSPRRPTSGPRSPTTRPPAPVRRLGIRCSPSAATATSRGCRGRRSPRRTWPGWSPWPPPGAGTAPSRLLTRSPPPPGTHRSRTRRKAPGRGTWAPR
jgi:hypothetical protein